MTTFEEQFPNKHPSLTQYERVIAEDGLEGYSLHAIDATQLDKQRVKKAIEKEMNCRLCDKNHLVRIKQELGL